MQVQKKTASSSTSTPGEEEARAKADTAQALLDETDELLDSIDEVLEASGALAEVSERNEFREKLQGWAKNQRRLDARYNPQDFLLEILTSCPIC